MHPLADLAARNLKKTRAGKLTYDAEAIGVIATAAMQLTTGEDLYAASQALIDFAAFLSNQPNSVAAGRALLSGLVPLLAERLARAAKNDEMREQARELARMSPSSSDRRDAMRKPARVGAGLRRR